MKPFLAALLIASSFTVTGSLASAQSTPPPQSGPSTYATFANVPFGSTAADVQKMMGDKGYEYDGAGKANDDKFTGRIGAYAADVYAFYDDNARLEKWNVNLETPDEEALTEFESLIKDFTGRFGLPLKVTRAESDPYKIGDNKVADAMKASKGTFVAYWNQKGDAENAIEIQITEVASVLISYEGPGWGAYVDRRDAKRKSDL